VVVDPGGLWYHGWVAGRYWPDHGDLLWETRNARLRRMSADERFVTTDENYWPAVGTMRPPPTVFIVLNPMELVWQQDLAVYLSDFRVLAETPDYLIFDLTRRTRTTAQRAASNQPKVDKKLASASWFLYRFPPAWRRIDRGMTKREVAYRLGRPRRTRTRSDLRKRLSDWFYSPDDRYAIVFINGRVFAKAAS
jgi:hypothetical protein